jgi:hypothetical protein
VVRDHLLQHGGDIGWAVDLDQGFEAPLPNLLAHLQLTRVLVVRALARGDAAAWDDLHAAAELTRSLHARPDLITQLIVLAQARMVNAAAWKLPLPAPQWLAEMHSVDHRRMMMRAHQHDIWLMWRHGPTEPSVWLISRPYLRLTTANMALLRRLEAFEIERIAECGFDEKEFDERQRSAIPRWNVIARIGGVDFGGPWARVLRYETEQEAVANALRIRGGASVVERSACSDGTWSFANGRLAFSRELPPPNSSAVQLPLELFLRPAPAPPRSTGRRRGRRRCRGSTRRSVRGGASCRARCGRCCRCRRCCARTRSDWPRR